MVNLVLFGPPGSGKGTQAENLIKKYQFVHTSTGDLLRNEIAEKTPLGMEAKKLMDKGILVPDEVVIGMISSKLDFHLQKGVKGFIFDGFPRTVPQAEALDKLLSLKKTSISIVLSLEVSEEELTKRILKRGESSNRPDDKDEDIIRKRVNEYFTKTAPVADFYKKQKKFHTIKGIGTVEEIFNALCTRIDKLK